MTPEPRRIEQFILHFAVVMNTLGVGVVLGLLAEGLSNHHLAQRLAISEHTAKFHVNAILYKLGARTRTDAVVRALRLGVLRL